MLQYDKEKENHKAMKIATCLGNSNTVQLEWHFLCIKRPKFHQQWPVSNGDNFIFPLIFKYFVVTLSRHFVWHFILFFSSISYSNGGNWGKEKTVYIINFWDNICTLI